jgi:hypothetical protein
MFFIKNCITYVVRTLTLTNNSTYRITTKCKTIYLRWTLFSNSLLLKVCNFSFNKLLLSFTRPLFFSKFDWSNARKASPFTVRWNPVRRPYGKITIVNSVIIADNLAYYLWAIFALTFSNRYEKHWDLKAEKWLFTLKPREDLFLARSVKWLDKWKPDTFMDAVTGISLRWWYKLLTNAVTKGSVSLDLRISLRWWYKLLVSESIEVYIRSLSFGFHYIQGCTFLLFIDACLTDDEPLWEPIEWSLVQTWILVIFMFGWIAENLIVSRYGSYTGRDKRVWMAWYKTFWFIEVYYVINFAIAALFVITPFYFEINYHLSSIYTWWHWYSRAFFFKFISIFSIILYLSYLLQISIRWLHWKKGLLVILIINIFLSYLIYTHFIMSFFGYFTDSTWYLKNRTNDYIQLSHTPARWGHGAANADHRSFHNSKSVFWFKNDGPFASAFLLFHLYLFLSLFFVYIYWITLFRRVYTMKEIPLTYTTYCVSTLKQFFYSFLMIYILVFISFIIQYWRLPIEFFWGINATSWYSNLWFILNDYFYFLLSILF